MHLFETENHSRSYTQPSEEAMGRKMSKGNFAFLHQSPRTFSTVFDLSGIVVMGIHGLTVAPLVEPKHARRNRSFQLPGSSCQLLGPPRLKVSSIKKSL